MISSNQNSQPKYVKLRCHDPDDEKKKHISPHIQNDTFLGEDLVYGADELIITEGIPDWYSAIDKGFKAISPGTTGFRTRDLEKLVKLTANAKAIYIINDNEKNNAGYEGAIRTANELTSNGRLVYIVKLPRPDGIDKVDLNDYLKTHTPEELRKLMKDAKSIFDILISELPENLAVAQEDIGEKIVPLLMNQPTSILQEVIMEIAEKTRLDDSAIEKLIIEKKKEIQAQADREKLDAQIEELNIEFAVINIGGKTRILHEQKDPVNPEQTNNEYKSESDFHLWLSNKTITIDGEAKKISKLWVAHPNRRQYTRLVFEPCRIIDPIYYNLWRGFAVEPVEGDCKLFLEHIRDNICNGNQEYFEYLIAWMADAIQNPNDRPGVAVVLRGAKGTGKNIFVDHFGKLFGQHYRQVTQARHLTGNFNSHLQDCLLLFANESFWAGDKQGENALKSLITDDTMNIEAKGKDIIELPNKIRLIMASNNDWIVPAGADERRYFVLEVGEKHKQDHQYFAKIVDQMENGGLEALLYFLQHYDYSDINLRVFPKTKALLDQKLRSLDLVDKFWYEQLYDGILDKEHESWG